MRTAEVESWVHTVADRVLSGQPVEDSRVECKRDWPGPSQKHARRLAAHANGASGDLILWIIGLDEKAGAATSVEALELSNWWSSIASHFDFPAIRLVDNLVVRHNEATLVALVFETDRAPYVVKVRSSDNEGADREVPWREGNSTRSARHEDLIRILLPRTRLPDVTLLAGQADATDQNDDDRALTWYVALDTYMAPVGRERVSLPVHDLELFFCLGESERWYQIPRPSILPASYGPSGAHSPFVVASAHECTLEGPGRVTISGQAATPQLLGVGEIDVVRVKAVLRAIANPTYLTLTATLGLVTHRQADSTTAWRWARRPSKGTQRGWKGVEFAPWAIARFHESRESDDGEPT